MVWAQRGDDQRYVQQGLVVHQDQHTLLPRDRWRRGHAGTADPARRVDHEMREEALPPAEDGDASGGEEAREAGDGGPLDRIERDESGAADGDGQIASELQARALRQAAALR